MMKKILPLLIVSLALSIPASATTPVTGYKLVRESAETSSEENWVEFKLSPGTDTLNGDWLRPEAEPEPLRTPAPDLPRMEGLPIGFNFPFAGRDMSVFGLTGDGLLYLGTETEFSPSYYATPTDHSLIHDVIQASPFKIDGGYRSPVVASDERTRISYRYDAENQKLSIRFKDIRLSGIGNDTCRWSYNLVLFANGDIAIDLIELDTMVATNSRAVAYLMCSLKGEHSEGYIMARDWNGQTSISSKAYLPVDGDNPEPGTRLRFTYPEPCTQPTGVEASITFRQLFPTSFFATLSLTGTYDGFIGFLADHASVEEKPVDGQTYAIRQSPEPADSIGGFPVLLSGTSTSLSVSGLQAGKTYHLYLYPYMNRCAGGPVYSGQAIVLPVTMPKAAPGIQSIHAGRNSITLAFAEPDPTQDILIGISRKDYAASNNSISLPEKEFQEGDTIFYQATSIQTGAYLIETVYAGKMPQEYTIEDLLEGTPYYLYVWGRDKTGFSIQYSDTAAHTTGSLPQTFRFATDRISNTMSPRMPAGWSSSFPWQGCPLFVGYNSNITIAKKSEPVFSEDEESRLLKASLRSLDNTPSYRMDAVTPPFTPGHSAVDVFSKFQMTARSGTSGNTCVQFAQTDTLLIQYKATDGSEWHDATLVTHTTELQYESDGFATIKTRIPAEADKDLQIRYLLKGTFGPVSENKVFALKSVYLEPGLDCLYPQNIQVNDSLTTHRVITFDYEDGNSSPASVWFRYKETDSNQWSDYHPAQEEYRCRIEGTQSNTLYSIAFRSVCGNDTSLVKIVEAKSKRGLPWSETFTERQSLPEDFQTFSGSLPDSGDAVLQTNTGGFSIIYDGKDGNALGIGLSRSDQWVVFPEISLENLPGDLELGFKAKAFMNKYPDYPALPEDCSIPILVLASQDKNFQASEVVDTLFPHELEPEYTEVSVLLPTRSERLYLALTLPAHEDYGTMEDLADYLSFQFALDSVHLDYIGDIPCPAVTDIRQSGLTTDGITLSWSGSALEYGILLENTSTSETDTIYTTENEYTLTGLNPGTLYLYHILSFCEEGHQSPGELSEEGFFTTNDICTAPENFAVIGTTWQSVTLTGHAPATILLHIWAEDRQSHPDIDYWFPDWETGIDTMIITGLFEAVNIDYLVAARSVCSPGDSSVWTDTLRFKTDYPECGQPTGLHSETTQNSALLSWTPGKNNDYYSLVWKPVSRNRYDSVYVQTPGWSLYDLEPNTTYVWQVQAICDQYLASQPAQAEFSTEDAGNQQDAASRISVTTSGKRISIFNPSGLPISKVEVFNMSGQQLYDSEPESRGNVLLPELKTSANIVLVRIVCENRNLIYKRPLL